MTRFMRFFFNNNAYVKSPGNISLFVFGCLAAIIQSHYKKSINVLPRYRSRDLLQGYRRNSPRERACEGGETW